MPSGASNDRNYQTGYAVTGYGGTSSGQLAVQQHTDTTSMEWCEDCDMAPGDCGTCVDDCGEWCGEPSMRQVGTTTQTYSFTGGYHGAAGLLVGDGDIPASSIGATQWQLQRGASFTAVSDAYYQVGMSFLVDGFADQLIHHGVLTTSDAVAAGGYGGYGGYGGGYGGPYDLGRYPGTVDSMDMFHWRGPYIADRINPDPWGNRYMANVFALHLPPATLYNAHAYWRRHQPFFNSAVVCYSAGPNEQIETAFNQPWGWYTGGDDQTVVLAGVGGIR